MPIDPSPLLLRLSVLLLVLLPLLSCSLFLSVKSKSYHNVGRKHRPAQTGGGVNAAHVIAIRSVRFVLLLFCRPLDAMIRFCPPLAANEEEEEEKRGKNGNLLFSFFQWWGRGRHFPFASSD